MEHILVLDDGTEVGADCTDVITELTVTSSVNDGTDLTFGSVCAAMLEVTILCPDGKPSVSPGDELTLYTLSGSTRTLTGIFLCAEASNPTAHKLRITAYDPIAKLDRDVAGFLSQATFPMALEDLLEGLMTECGLQFSGELPMGDFLAAKPAVAEVSGRQMLRWIGQAAGVYFVYSPRDDAVVCGWYGGTPINVSPTQIVQNGLNAESYDTASVTRVQIRTTASDVGTVWPTDAPEVRNTYTVQGNPLLAGDDSSHCLPVAEHLYDRLQEMTYCPGKVKLFSDCRVRAGDTVLVTDRDGVRKKMLAMTVTEKGRILTVECTGNPHRENTAAVNSTVLMQGKVLELQTAVEGLKAKNRDAEGHTAEIAMDVETIQTKVTEEETRDEMVRHRLSVMEQTSDGIRMDIRKLQEGAERIAVTGKNYTFDGDGLRIADSGRTMMNILDENGMEVRQGERTLLRASIEGVKARDLKAENYLSIAHSRFENYGNGRTACYYI